MIIYSTPLLTELIFKIGEGTWSHLRYVTPTVQTIEPVNISCLILPLISEGNKGGGLTSFFKLVKKIRTLLSAPCIDLLKSVYVSSTFDGSPCFVGS